MESTDISITSSKTSIGKKKESDEEEKKLDSVKLMQRLVLGFIYRVRFLRRLENRYEKIYDFKKKKYFY